VFGANAFRPFIDTVVRNCPNGAIDFTDVGNFGGFVRILGALDFELQTAQTGQATYGFQGAPPSSFDVDIVTVGTGNNSSLQRSTQPRQLPAGSAAFPALIGPTDITSGLFFPTANQVALAAAAVEKLRVDNDATAGNTGLLLWDVDAGTLKRVKVAPGNALPGAGAKFLVVDA
jgi:hypothetical protein